MLLGEGRPAGDWQAEPPVRPLVHFPRAVNYSAIFFFKIICFAIVNYLSNIGIICRPSRMTPRPLSDSGELFSNFFVQDYLIRYCKLFIKH